MPARLMTASSAAPGVIPVLQLPGVSQSPPAALIHVTLEGKVRSSRHSSQSRGVPLGRGARRQIGARAGRWKADLRKRSQEVKNMVVTLHFRGCPWYNENAIAFGARRPSAGAVPV